MVTLEPNEIATDSAHFRTWLTHWLTQNSLPVAYVAAYDYIVGIIPYFNEYTSWGAVYFEIMGEHWLSRPQTPGQPSHSGRERQTISRALIDVKLLEITSTRTIITISAQPEFETFATKVNQAIRETWPAQSTVPNSDKAPEAMQSTELSTGSKVLLVTVNEIESKAVIEVFQESIRQVIRPTPIGDRIYHDLGIISGARVFMVQSEMGAGGLGASQQTVQKGIAALSPIAIIMVGIAFGIDVTKHSIGDILVSQQLLLYELQRVGTYEGEFKIIPRGDRPHSSPWLFNRFKSASLYWDELKPKVRFGLILSGEKLVDNIDFRQQLLQVAQEAIGGEMEGAGLYAACHDSKVDWILVKAKSRDWADGQKDYDKNQRQMSAARNAALFVLHALKMAPL